MTGFLAGCALFGFASWQTITRAPALLTRSRRRRAVRETVAAQHPADIDAGTGAAWFDDLPVSCLCCDGPASCGEDR